MPESRHKYLYERLGDQDFQQLVSALLANQFPGYTPMALRQADGGRDGLRRDEAGRLLVYQVKWSVDGREKDPVSWLDAVVRLEGDSLRRLAARGVRHYTLVTNVPSTAKPDSGTFDRLNEKLESHARAFGYEQMTCVWRETLNAWVDDAPQETKWAYAEMLAGWDLVRYLVAEQAGAAKDKGLRDLVRKVAAVQWEEDKKVKFSQSDVDREKVVDLFVDVTAERVHTAAPTVQQPLAGVGGAAAYLLRSPAPFTLVRGAPGQGKSTLSQYVCQAHRASFLPEAERPDALPALDEPRFPVRVDLSDYARWLTGADIWDDSGTPAKARTGDRATIEHFLADLLTHESGRAALTADDMQDIFNRLPSLVVLDGLDEVGSLVARGKVVRAIDNFAARGKTYTDPPKIVVTTRPSAGALPEPSPSLFEIITLNHLTTEQRDSYLRKWCSVRGIGGRDGRELRKTFKEKSREPYIGELAGNPMQLTILLDLLHQQGAATPTQRTDLYDRYVDLLLAREANKHPKAVRVHREELLEIIPFLGWYLHAHTEESQINGRMSVDELKAAMQHFQRTYDKPESVVDELFEGASERLWALTSKVDGTYEFEVLSLREYFAARFLYRNAGEDDPDFDSTAVLRELLRRPYWLNTARFYGGNAKDRGIYALTAGIEEELRHGPAASFLAAWALLTDGAFHRRPGEARKVVAALCSDTGLAVLLPALDRFDIAALPQLPYTPDGSSDPTWERLTALIAKDPTDWEANDPRVRALRELLNQPARFATWWYEQYSEAVGTPRQDAWLRLGGRWEAAPGQTVELDALDLSGEGAAESFLSAGLVAQSGSDLEAALLDAVLDGQCAGVLSVRSMPAQVAVALSPDRFFTDREDRFLTDRDHSFYDPDEQLVRLRSQAITQLRKDGSPYAQIAKLRAFRAGYKGSTFPWERPAAALYEHAGRCWLASEIAILGAASPFNLAYTKRPASTAFGATAHPSELLAQTRTNAADSRWWSHQLDACEDDLARAEWALALWAVASSDVVSGLRTTFERVLADLPASRSRVLKRAASRLSAYGWGDKYPVDGTAADPWLTQAIVSGAGGRPSLRDGWVDSPVLRQHTSEPALLSVARAQRWLKVDSKPSYR